MSKTVLITGASTGFGRQTAETLALAGHQVFASMRDPNTKNRAHAEALRAQGIQTLALDVTQESSVSSAVDAVHAQAGRIDVLVNNAGVASAGVTEAFSPEQLTALFDVNVVGLHRVTRAVLPEMRRAQAGLIINVGSILGRVTFPFFGAYGASKYAVEALTDSLRYETSPFGVDVALVQPSAYPTAMYGSAALPVDTARVTSYGETGNIPGAMFEHFTALFSSEEAPDPQDVADAILGLVDTPQGERPAPRTVVGEDFGATQLNQLTAPVQAAAVQGLGLAHLDTQQAT